MRKTKDKRKKKRSGPNYETAAIAPDETRLTEKIIPLRRCARWQLLK
jgi:hypothetical protein